MHRSTFRGLLVLSVALSPLAMTAPLTLAAQSTKLPPPAPLPPPASPKAPLAPVAPIAPKSWDMMLDFPETMAEALAMSAVDLAQVKADARIQARMAADEARLQVELARDQIADAASIAKAIGSSFNYSFSSALAPLAIGRGYRTAAPEPWAPQDAADALYRDARKALADDQYEKAAGLFQQIWRKYPSSTYTPDAYYWQAFALQRQGGDRNLGEALASLETQQQKFPKAATRGDANALRARIEGQLGRRDREMATTLKGRAERASDGCPRADEDERIEALNAVTQMDREQALPILRKVLARREPCTQQLRRTAVMLLARRNQPDVAAVLLNVAKTDPDRDVREQAVFWMANVQSDEATDMLIDLAKSGDDLELRKRALYALSRSKSTKASATFRQIVLDENQPDELRGDALSWVGSRPGDSGQFAFLRELYGKGGTVNFRQRVLSMMTRERSEEARAFFVSVALNEREPMDLRRAAVSSISSGARWGSSSLYRVTPSQLAALTGSGQTSVTISSTSSSTSGSASGNNSVTEASAKAAITAAVNALSTVYDKAGDLEIRRQALSALASMNDAGVDKLIDVARNEKNVELRRSAVSALSRTKDPRAVQLLQDIINK